MRKWFIVLAIMFTVITGGCSIIIDEQEIEVASVDTWDADSKSVLVRTANNTFKVVTKQRLVPGDKFILRVEKIEKE